MPLASEHHVELIMRRYERAAAILTSNRPVDDWADIIDTIHGRREMRFRLVYDGPLTTGKSRHKSDNKWEIRRQLAPQLAELWTFKPALLGEADADLHLYQGPKGAIVVDRDENTMPNDRRRQFLLMPFDRAGYGYIPIVREDLFLTCTIDILFLRKDSTEVVSNCGDLDNRIKNLFDALRMPELNEQRPEGLENPLYVLAEDDRLITSFAIRTDRLLSRPQDSPEAVMLVMDVVIAPSRIKAALNSGFTWD
jgi:hypothetical protein